MNKQLKKMLDDFIKRNDNPKLIESITNICNNYPTTQAKLFLMNLNEGYYFWVEGTASKYNPEGNGAYNYNPRIKRIIRVNPITIDSEIKKCVKKANREFKELKNHLDYYDVMMIKDLDSRDLYNWYNSITPLITILKEMTNTIKLEQESRKFQEEIGGK